METFYIARDADGTLVMFNSNIMPVRDEFYGYWNINPDGTIHTMNSVEETHNWWKSKRSNLSNTEMFSELTWSDEPKKVFMFTEDELNKIKK